MRKPSKKRINIAREAIANHLLKHKEMTLMSMSVLADRIADGEMYATLDEYVHLKPPTYKDMWRNGVHMIVKNDTPYVHEYLEDYDTLLKANPHLTGLDFHG